MTPIYGKLDPGVFKGAAKTIDDGQHKYCCDALLYLTADREWVKYKLFFAEMWQHPHDLFGKPWRETFGFGDRQRVTALLETAIALENYYRENV